MYSNQIFANGKITDLRQGWRKVLYFWWKCERWILGYGPLLVLLITSATAFWGLCWSLLQQLIGVSVVHFATASWGLYWPLLLQLFVTRKVGRQIDDISRSNHGHSLTFIHSRIREPFTKYHFESEALYKISKTLNCLKTTKFSLKFVWLSTVSSRRQNWTGFLVPVLKGSRSAFIRLVILIHN